MPALNMSTYEDVMVFMPVTRFDAERQLAVESALTEANATIARLQTALQEATRQNEGLLRTNREQSDKLRQAAVQIEDLLKRVPSVIVTPEPPKPAPEAHPVFPFTGAYFENPLPNDSVNNQADAKAYADAVIPSMVFAAENSTLRDYIWYGNLEDFKWSAVIRTMRDLEKRWWLSPAQAYYGKTEFTRHLQSAYDAGCYGVFVDDAHNTKAFITPLLDAINRYMPGAPIICSFGANYDDIAEGFPHERYYDMRQWFLERKEDEGVWFTKWETAHDAQLYAADVYRRGSGWQHTPAKIQSMFETALPFVEGIAWYSLINKETDIRADHLKAKAANPGALTVWDVIARCSERYLRAYEARRVKA